MTRPGPPPSGHETNVFEAYVAAKQQRRTHTGISLGPIACLIVMRVAHSVSHHRLVRGAKAEKDGKFT